MEGMGVLEGPSVTRLSGWDSSGRFTPSSVFRLDSGRFDLSFKLIPNLYS